MDLNITVPGNSEPKGVVSVSDSTFAQDFNEALVHQVVTAYLAGGRQGTRAQKNRSDVRGGGAKPWRQKGTGRARAGSIRSPIWRSGGVTFAARPQDFSQKVNKKMYRGAMRSIVSELIRQDRLIVVESLAMAEAKTRNFVALMKQLDITKALFLSHEVDENLYLASRNIPNILVMDAIAVDPVSLVKFDKIVVTEAALKQLEEKLA